MNRIAIISMLLFFSSHAFCQDSDPMGLSNYIINEPSTDRQTWTPRRLTNHEVSQFQQSGAIHADGSIDQDSTNVYTGNLPPPPVSSPPPPGTSVEPPIGSPPPVASGTPQIIHKPLPTSKHVAKQTGTKHIDHPESKGTIHVRPAQFPDNPSRNEIVHMQQDIQHIERTVGRALDLSLSAYAVAELPQATEGRSSINFGVSAADGRSAEAIGYSSNFGDNHEYTIKVSVSHASEENAAGAGIGYQW